MSKRFAIVIGVATAGVMALGAQSAAAGEPVDTVPPDIWLWGVPTGCCLIEVTQKFSKAVEVNVGCGDEACTVGVKGELSWGFHHGCGGPGCVPRADPDHKGKTDARLRTHEYPYVRHDRLRRASADVGPGETTQLKLWLKKKARKEARRALAKGKGVSALVTAHATDAAGNETGWQGQGAIYLYSEP